MSENGCLPLFETKAGKGRGVYRMYVVSVVVSLFFIWVYRVNFIPTPGEAGRWAWIGLFMAELWFSFYWFVTQFVRWNPVYRFTFKDRLSQRYEKRLPRVDIFVCTADPVIEPPLMVVNTVLSVMAYNYPPEKLSVYLSDDGGSTLTFYALLEAAHFSKHWLPFCKKFKVEPRSPMAYFAQLADDNNLMDKECSSIKKLYEDMKNRIEKATMLGHISEEIQNEHKGFHEWDLYSSRHYHQAIIQILIDGMDPNSVDSEGQYLPTLVYVAREKRPQYHSNFKAGAMNALIRVSSEISNGGIILNVDCDMYSNNSESIRDAMCFFMDEDKGPEIAYVQYPQGYDNLTKNDIYASELKVINELELPGMDGNGGVFYIGSGCFHRRDSLCGAKYNKGCEKVWVIENVEKRNETTSCVVLEERCKLLASCACENNTQWGKEMGLKYGFPAEDIVTGLAIQARGWKSMYFNPEREGFLGVAPTTLLSSLIQHKRWSEGQFKTGLSTLSSLLYEHENIPLKLLLSCSPYLFWAPNCLPTLYYVAIPSLCLFKGISLFPKVSSLWVLPFSYVIITKYAFSLGEFLNCGGTLQGWWNEQRIWMFRRTTSYLLGFINTISNQLGVVKLGFVVTEKMTHEDVSKRFMKEEMEFGADSSMFTILATQAMLNLFSFIWVVLYRVVQKRDLEPLALQIILCGLVVLINLPLYRGLFFRRDKGSMPTSVIYKSLVVSVLVCSIALY